MRSTVTGDDAEARHNRRLNNHRLLNQLLGRLHDRLLNRLLKRLMKRLLDRLLNRLLSWLLNHLLGQLLSRLLGQLLSRLLSRLLIMPRRLEVAQFGQYILNIVGVVNGVSILLSRFVEVLPIGLKLNLLKVLHRRQWTVRLQI